MGSTVAFLVAASEAVTGAVDWYGIAATISATASLVAAIFAGLAHYRIGVAKGDIHRIEVATNNMKDELVRATRSGALAEGEAKGRADQKNEENRAPRPEN